ncbi:MAG TPA: hypothetical protein VF207_06520, partial [Chthoniobacterales bacterium]
ALSYSKSVAVGRNSAVISTVHGFEARLILVDLGAVDSILPMRVRVAVGGSTGGESLFAQISIDTPQPLGSKNRPIRICFGNRAASSKGKLAPGSKNRSRWQALPLLSTAAATVLFQELDLFDRTIRDFLTKEIMSSIATTSQSLLLNGSRTR